MKKAFIYRLKEKLFISACLVFYTSAVFGQVTGTKTIGIDYLTLTAAITDLNSVGISGAVTINVPAGYTETAPTGGYLLGSTILNASTSATNTLTFQKSGAGADPLLTAPVGASLTLDGIFTIQGTDYVTIDGIDITESSANTTPTTWMEWGYGLIKLQNVAPFDGCQNVTIQNCTVTLNRLNTPSVGIFANNQVATATTALAITATTDAMSNCRFYSNTIQNCNTGISLRGFAAAASPYTLYDQNNDIGGAGAATSNIIQNYAGATAGSGINLRYQNNANIAYNTINNIAGSGIAATNNVYGVYAQNGTNPNVTITNNTINLTQGTTGSALYGVNISFSGTGTIDVNNNTFTANGGSTATMYMIYLSSANTTVNTNGNNFYNINVATTGSLYMIYHSSAATTANITCNNNFTSGPATPYVNKTGAGGTIAGYYNNSGSSGGFASINNNNFSYITLAGSPTFYGINETDGGSGQSKFLHNNIISHITSTGGGTFYGLRAGFAASINFSNNSVSFLNAGTGTAYGISPTSGTTDTIMNNNIHDLTSTGANVYGIYVNGGTTISVFQDTVYTLSSSGTTGLGYGIWQGSGTTVNVYQNKIYDIAASGTGSSVNGMYLNSGTVTVYNNLVGDLRTPNYNGAGGTQLVGIYLGGGTSYGAYYNSVYVNGTSTGTDFGSCAVFASSTPSVTLRNNIFVNTSTPNGAGLTVAYRRGSTTLTTYQAASNNNLFYAGTPGTANVIFYDGTTPYMTLGDFKTLVAPRDVNSVTENPPFLSIVGSSANFLHINTTVPTQIESGAINIAGITTDADGNIRAGNPGYSGTGSAPDIGAEEGEYILTDLSAPSIIYTLLPDSCTTGDRILVSTITDATGVPTSGTLVPRIYYNKDGGTWFSSAGVLTAGTGLSGTWTFTISATAMGGLSIGDAVSYFVIAQDIAPTSNIGSNPSAGLVATDVNTISTFPTTPNVYVVLGTLSGTYNVGVGMAYATISNAIDAYNSSCISGPVVFQLTDASYSGSEAFPITINSNVTANATNTLTIKPATGISPSITGNASAIFILNGADYVTIEGSNSPLVNSVCPRVASGRDMTISNTSTSTTSAVVWMRSAGASNGATNNTIRNCNIIGSGNTQTLFGIGSGGTTIAYTSVGSGNNNNRIENDSILATQTGIFSMGASAANKNTGTVINQNLINGTTPNNLRNNGIFVGFEDGITISGNYVANITNAASNDIIGINLGFGNNATSNTITTGNDVTNATVTNNKLDNISQTNTWSCLGIAVAGVTSGTTTIANNMISGVLAKGTASDFSSGIFIGGATGGTTNVFYNSVNMTGTLTGGSVPCFAISVSGSNPTVNLKNNIFVNASNPGSLGLVYAIGLAYTTFTNLSSDANDFYSIGANLGLTGSLGTGGTASATLAAWQATTGTDINSKNINPVFVSASDLHVTPAGANVPLMNTGVPVAITTDYDCAPRDPSTPDIGLNEFTVPTCSSVTAGIATPVIPAFCASGITTINVTGATSAYGISYQWETSTDSASWTTISGATNTSYAITPAITTTTFYRFVVTCSFSGISDSTSTVVIIHPLPVVSVTPDGGAYCSGPSGSVGMTASGAGTYTWLPSVGLSATTGASVTASPIATTTYTITGTDTFGCVGVHTSSVIVTVTPPPVVVSPTSTTFCSGSSIALSATDSLPSTIFADDFNSGLGLWTIDNTGSTSAGSIPLTQWTARPDGYSYSSDVFHSPDASQFAMSNSDPGGSGSTTHSMLISPVFSLVGYTSATLTFQHYYRYISSTDQAMVEISTDGGSSWALINNYTPGGVSVGSAASFASASFDLSPYLGNPNCQLRFNFLSHWGWYWAIDNVAINGSGTYSNIVWSPFTGLYDDAGLTTPYTGAVATTVYAAPTTTTTPVVLTYTATATNGACADTGTAVVTVNPIPDAGTITGTASGVCVGSVITLTDVATGGVWISSNSSASVVDGDVTGVTAGIDTIWYTVTNVCGADTATMIVTVNPLPDAGTVSGLSTVCVGSSITLTDAAPGGAWSSSTTSASVTGGVVTGVSAGVTDISYSVTNVCGTAVADMEVTVNPLPDAGSISGPSIVCEGSVITLTDIATGGVWSSSSSSASVSGGVVTGVSAGTTTISYTVTNVCGTDIATKAITVNPLPVAGVITGFSSLCEGTIIALTDAAPGGVWSSSSASASVSGGLVTGVSAGTATISYSVTNSCGTAIATKNVTVNPQPVAGSISGAASVCVGSSITLSDPAPGGVWSSSNASATVTVTGIVTGVSTGSPIISYTVTNVCGTAIAIHPINVYPLPFVYNVTGGGTYCAGGAGVDIGLDGSTTGITYQLYNGATLVSSLAGTGFPLDFGLQTGAGAYAVIATSAFGCTMNMNGSAIVTINPILSPSVSITTGVGDTVCAASFVTFTPIPVNGGATPSYEWSVNGVAVSTTPTYTYSPANGDVVSVTVTSSACALPDTASSSVTMTVVPVATPSVSIITGTGTDTSCSGFPVTFTAVAVFGGDSATYRWTVNGVNVATGPMFTYIPANGDVIYVMMRSSFACRLFDSVFSSSITLHTVPLLAPSVVVTASPGLAIEAGVTDTFTATVTHGGPAPLYQWLINGYAITGATNATFMSNILNNGDVVSCSVTSSGFCFGLTTMYSVTIAVSGVGVKQITTGITNISVLPNPNQGEFTITGTLSTVEDKDVTLEVADMLGQIVYKDKVVARHGQINQRITLNNTLANGMYILNVQTEEEHKVFHFVIEK